MSLKEVIKETREKLEEAVKEEEKLIEEVEEKAGENPEIEAKEKKKEEVKAQEKTDDKPVEEVKKTSADYAKERREQKQSRISEELEAANARIAALEASLKPKEEVKAEQEPSKVDDPQAWTEWKLRQADSKLEKAEEKLAKVEKYTAEDEKQRKAIALRDQAVREVEAFEGEVRQQNPDYDDVKRYYANMLAASIKIVNPRMSNDTLVNAVNNRMLARASELLNEGHDNPIAAMYDEAKKLGYQPKSADNENAKEVKPDLDRVSENRKRNAGTAGAQGRGDRGELTPKVAAGMTNAEFAKLSKDEKKRMFDNLRMSG